MQITDVKIFLKEGQDKKLKAYATVTFDGVFVVRNIKVIDGNKGLFVAMPSRKLKDPCPKCNFRNTVRSKFCNQCGASLPMTEPRQAVLSGPNGADDARQSEHKDIAHPITAECRDYIQKKVLEAFDKEKKSPSTGQHAPHAQHTASPERAPSAPSAPSGPSVTARPHITVDDEDIEL
jgi:stage V sporulation protein G